VKALLQRVTSASVSIDGEVVGSIGRGLVVFVGVVEGDSPKDADYKSWSICASLPTKPRGSTYPR